MYITWALLFIVVGIILPLIICFYYRLYWKERLEVIRISQLCTLNETELYDDDYSDDTNSDDSTPQPAVPFTV